MRKLTPLVVALLAFLGWTLANAAHDHKDDDHHPHHAGDCILCSVAWEPEDDLEDLDDDILPVAHLRIMDVQELLGLATKAKRPSTSIAFGAAIRGPPLNS